MKQKHLQFANRTLVCTEQKYNCEKGQSILKKDDFYMQREKLLRKMRGSKESAVFAYMADLERICAKAKAATLMIYQTLRLWWSAAGLNQTLIPTPLYQYFRSKIGLEIAKAQVVFFNI